MAGAEDTTGGQNRFLLYDVSDELEKRNVCIDQIKFALFDFILGANLEEVKSPFDIFSELGKTRKLPDVINILIALFKLLWLDALNDIFFKSGFPTADIQPTNVFSPFRISIVNMSNHLQNSKISRISGVFAVPKEKCLNQWKLLQYLQDEGKLNKENLIQFVEKFGINKGTLEWHPAEAPLALQPALQPAASDHTAQAAASSSVYLASGSKPHFRSSHAGQLSSFSGYTASANQFVSEGALQIPAHMSGAVNTPGEKYARHYGEASSSTAQQMSTLVDASSQPQDGSGNDYQKFRKFLREFSTKYPGDYFLWLRFLLYDILPILVLSKVNGNVLDLFNELDRRNLISPTNITILSDISETTNFVAAKKCVDVYRQSMQCKEGKGLMLFRKYLFKALIEVADDELNVLVAYYNIGYLNIDCLWNLVFHLEKNNQLDNPEKWEIFADCLNTKAKTMITDAVKTANLQPTVATEARIETALAESEKLQAEVEEAVNRERFSKIEAAITESEKMQVEVAEAVKQETMARKAEKEANEKAMKDNKNAMEAKAAEGEAKAAEREAKARAVESEKEAEELEEKARAAREAAIEVKGKLVTVKTAAEHAELRSKVLAELYENSKRAAEKAKAELNEAEKLKEASVKAAEKAAAALNSLLYNKY